MKTLLFVFSCLLLILHEISFANPPVKTSARGICFSKELNLVKKILTSNKAIDIQDLARVRFQNEI